MKFKPKAQHLLSLCLLQAISCGTLVAAGEVIADKAPTIIGAATGGLVGGPVGAVVGATLGDTVSDAAVSRASVKSMEDESKSKDGVIATLRGDVREAERVKTGIDLGTEALKRLGQAVPWIGGILGALLLAFWFLPRPTLGRKKKDG